MNVITKMEVENAIRRYERGERPFQFTEPRSWYVLGKNDRVYPLKYIYALIADQPPRSFNTSEPLKVFGKLGISTIHQPKSHHTSFDARVKASLRNPKTRRARLAKADKRPLLKKTVVFVFDRNPDVVAEVLARAAGHCENCGQPAPFKKAKDQSPYLEVHHKIMLANDGDDTVKNAIAVCPNCHRQAHYG